jgi:hypothetical protein
MKIRKINESLCNLSDDDLLKRTKILIDFLDTVSDENDEAKVIAGDVMGYLCGYVDITSPPEDEIEVFD